MTDPETPPEKPRRRWPAINLNRQVLGVFGLVIGFVVYQAALRLPAPWSAVAVGGCFVLLGAVVCRYARGERWIQALGLLLAAYGVVRMFLK